MAMNLEQAAREVVSILESRGGEMAYADLVEVMEQSGLAQAVPLLQKMRGNTLKFGVRRAYDVNGIPGIEHSVRPA